MASLYGGEEKQYGYTMRTVNAQNKILKSIKQYEMTILMALW